MQPQKDIKAFLDRKVEEYNRPSFIAGDPIGIPHRYSKKQDIEIAGFFAAIFSWGNRTTIIKKSLELMHLLRDAPHQFILQHEEKDLRDLLHFKHRTFNTTDLLYFIAFLRHHYTNYDSLEDAFLQNTADATRAHSRNSSLRPSARISTIPRAPAPPLDLIHPVDPVDPIFSIEASLSAFRPYFFSLDEAPPRTHKHIASPATNSSCKRLNMFLRWMVRKDDRGVDFGIWNRIPPSRLICPLDLHVGRVALRFGLLRRQQANWQAAKELTDYLIILDGEDPVKYDFALFGLGVMENF
jgi:uncharacterized protein (TIGR02757 family)